MEQANFEREENRQMEATKLFDAEWNLMCFVWANQPSTASQAAAYALKAFNWKKNTTYTVIKRLVEKKIGEVVNSLNEMVHGFDFAKLLSESLGGVAVSLTNDANAAAMGEMTYGVARGMKNFIMITLGTGVGSGIVIDGKVVYGHDGNAGELGHTCAVRYNGRPCGCGKTGCLEAYCSAIGVARTAREMLELTDEPSLLRGVEDLSSKSVYEAAVEGDALALRIFDYTGKMLGRSFADFVAFSAPEAIVLFGGLARAKEFFYEPMLQSMNENLMHQWKGKVKIVFSQLKESDAAILGASALAWEL